MVDETERLVLQMSADLSRLNKGVGDAQKQFDRRLLQMETRARQADKNLSRIMGQAGANLTASLKSGLSSIVPTLAAAFSAQQVLKYADSYTSLQNRLKAAGLQGEALIRVENDLFEIANRNGLQVQATAELYSRASLSRQRLGATEEQLRQLVSGTAAALKVQGTSAEAASGPLLQLGQVLSGNKVQAEEYNSLIDGLPVLLQAAAKGSARFGGDVASLTEQVKAGKVSSQEFFQALLAGFPELEKQAGGAATTIGSALQTLDNELGRYVGQTDASLGASARLAEGIEALANNLDKIIPVVTTLATIIGVGYAGSLTVAGVRTAAATVETVRYQLALLSMQARATGASSAQIALNAAMAANPVGLVVTVVAALAAGLFVLASRYNSTAVAARELDAITSAADTAIGEYAAAVLQAKNASGQERIELLAKADALREVTQARINDARVAAQRQISEAVNARARADDAIRTSGATRRSVGRNAGSNAGSALAGGAQSRAQGAIDLAVRARQEADRALQALSSLERAQQQAAGGRQTSAGTRPSPAAETPVGGDAKGSSGPSPEDLAAQREMLRLQGQVEILKAHGREADAASVQRQIDILNLTKTFKDAEVTDAKAAATAQVDAIARGEAAQRGQAFAEEQTKFFLGAANEAIALQNDQMLDRLGYEAELARLSGDPARVLAAERELFIAERVNELLRLRPGLKRGEAAAEAGREFDTLNAAGNQGDLRNEFRTAFSDGIKAAIDGDLGGFFESMADRFTSRLLDNLADDLFDILGKASKGLSGSGSGGDFAAVIGSLFGKRALGGPVSAGQPYIVGERRAEVFVPKVSGTVLPSVNDAMQRAGRSRAIAAPQTVRVIVAPADDRFDAYVDGRAVPAATQAAAQGTSFSRAQIPTDLTRTQTYRRGR